MIELLQEMKVRLTFFEEVLGTSSNNPEIHDEFIASKAKDAPSREEEVEALGVGEVVEKSMTVFPRMIIDGNSVPFVWDYQVKGFSKTPAERCVEQAEVLAQKSRRSRKRLTAVFLLKNARYHLTTTDKSVNVKDRCAVRRRRANA